ncbi:MULTISPECIES: MFS transporter [Halocynthiibacter]|uniref:MFS transporter n=1 Tax=Halocynthiibacter halioticoli TaxID=2986804 RepID=A0AAE3LR85_9RHOB|nr:MULTISPECIES: MFS transporter [Halocynthiibacter]MCV6824249.1 MFS transporter [Halocynthiibacter halioticoli]MCW4057250.1 MFS transporter [Halocynthiibacter sp. SDUM655004]
MTETHLYARARRNVAVLVAAQAVLGAQLPMIFTYAGLAGQNMATNVCFATMPVTMIVLGSMLAASPISSIMQKYGRKTGFFIGALGGFLGAAISAYGLFVDSFALLLLGSLVTGIYMSSQGFFRFAAVDTAPDGFRAKAISWVMAGGLASAVIGPQLGKGFVDSFVVPFMGMYFAVMALNLIGSLLFFFLDIPTPEAPKDAKSAGRTRWEMLKTPEIAVAIICAMVSYSLMNLVMTSTPLAVVGCGFGNDDAADVVSGHVFAMFAPSFFTGHLIARFGVEKIVALGLATLAAAGVVALSGVELSNFFIALILLGVGWNFGFIGATTMLARAHTEEERGRVQGLNDMLVFGCVTLASLSSGGLMNCSGGDPVQGWTAVNIAMIPLLTLAGGALIWLVMRPAARERV